MTDHLITSFDIYNNFKLSIYTLSILNIDYNSYKTKFGYIFYWESAITKTIHILPENDSNIFFELFIFNGK